MASIATVVTMGFGTFGDVTLLPTLGYGIGEAAIIENRKWITLEGQRQNLVLEGERQDVTLGVE